MSKLEIHQIPVLSDNYVYLFRDPESGLVGVVDPAVADPVLGKLKELGWTLTHIINTHHHPDHTGANLELKEKTGCTIVGAKNDAARIPGIDIKVEEGDILVAANTGVSWTPVFNLISGAVVDMGGSLAHAAVVGREFGIPVVTNTLFGTQRIKTGQRVRVDGNMGVIYYLDK